MSGSIKRPRRRLSDEFKRGVVAEASAPGVSVSAVARHYELNANQVFNWRRRYGGGGGAFLPVAVVGSGHCEDCATGLREARAGEIEITLAGGHRVTVRGGFDGDAVASLLRGLVS